MAIDAQIPLSGAQQPGFAEQAGQVYKLADAVEKQKETQQQQQDQQLIQQALKDGADINTPDGIAALGKKLGGNVSAKTSMMFAQAHQDALVKDAQATEYYNKASKEALEAHQGKIEYLMQGVETPLNAHKEAIKAGKTPEEANLALESARAQVIQQAQNLPPVGGKPQIDEATLNQFKGQNVAQLQTTYDNLKSTREKVSDATKLRKEESEIEFIKERTKALKQGEAAGTFDEKGLESAGAQIAAGMPSTQVIPGMASKVGAKREAARLEAIDQIIAENPGMTSTEAGIELAQRGIDYAATKTGRMQTARTIGATEANIVMASSEAKKMIAIVRDVESKMNLTEYPSINAIENAVSKGTGGIQIVKLNNALMALINTYARAINPKGVPTVEDKKVARDALNTALAKGQMEGGLGIMEQEMDASLASPAAARKVLDRVRALGGKETNTGKSTEAKNGTAWSASDEARLKELEAKHGAQ
jgi:hypothetical protein